MFAPAWKRSSRGGTEQSPSASIILRVIPAAASVVIKRRRGRFAARLIARLLVLIGFELAARNAGQPGVRVRVLRVAAKRAERRELQAGMIWRRACTHVLSAMALEGAHRSRCLPATGINGGASLYGLHAAVLCLVSRTSVVSMPIDFTSMHS